MMMIWPRMASWSSVSRNHDGSFQLITIVATPWRLMGPMISVSTGVIERYVNVSRTDATFPGVVLVHDTGGVSSVPRWR